MGLPIQKSPVYQLTVPSTKQKIEYRPFLVKEEKALLLAEQSEDTEVMVTTLKKIIADCTFDKVDPDKLAVFDMEFILTKLRSKSIGEIAQLNVTCKSCHTQTMVNVDLSNLEIKRFDEHTNKIELFDDVGVMMKYPKIDILQSLTKTKGDADIAIDAIIDCIDYIYDSNSVYHAAEQTKEELSTFIDNLNRGQLDKIEKFFETMPKLEIKVDLKCPQCGTDNNITLEGIQDFF